MADHSAHVSRRAVFRGAFGLTVLGAGAVLAGCGAAEKLGVTTEFKTTGPYGVSELQRIAYGSDESTQYGMLAVPVQDNGEPVSEAVPVVVMIHGGSWEDASDMSYMTDIGTDLVSYGVAVWSIAYRGTIHPDQRDRGPHARAGLRPGTTSPPELISSLALRSTHRWSSTANGWSYSDTVPVGTWPRGRRRGRGSRRARSERIPP